MGIISHLQHPNIIQFYGVTKLDTKLTDEETLDEVKFALVLEYVNGGTLENYLRDNAKTFKWEKQLRFAKEIVDAISWCHNKEIIHGDLHSKNILIHQIQPNQHAIKLADFGSSFLQGCNTKFTKACGVVPYMDPKIFESHLYNLTKKSDIYSLGVLLWQLTSCSSPFGFAEIKDDHAKIISLQLSILRGKRENPVSHTNKKFGELFQKCWEHEPDKRPDIPEVISELNSIKSENNNVLTNFNSKESVKAKIFENEDFDLSNCDEDCDLSKIFK
ncbi:kinase-like domain-containing protein [Glomus cerebriforme]|uniref:Kinase-like domain-containing protein n=1 Tax=Glomus cerebriforme TaxID=658196 RepID=A0A397SMG8_9GLOM|nr:kinase-like domain-containing protein [Glomus cerebriforme]